MMKRVSTIGYAAALASMPAWVTACSSSPATEGDAQALFSLTADQMQIQDVDGMDMTVVMKNVDPHTVWFTDRPARESGVITTEQLVAQWDDGETFDTEPPNAALVLHVPATVEDGSVTETIVAEVRDAAYDAATNTFYARLHALSIEEAGTVSGSLSAHADGHALAWPNVGGAVSLFIDDVAADTLTDPAVLTTSSTPTPSPKSAPGTTTSDAGKATVNTQAPKSNMITLCSNPSSCQKTSTTNYTYNSTIYFQATITNDVTMSEELFAPDSSDQQGELL